MIFDKLLPRGRAWALSKDKNLTKFFNGLSGLETDIELFADEIWADIYPQTTRQLDEWEKEFSLPNINSLTDQQRRDRLIARWRERGGQDPKYIQKTLQESGFDVYVHEFWELPRTAPPSVRNPLLYLRDDGTPPIYTCEADEPLAQAGEANATAGDPVNNRGYLLVNKIVESRPAWLTLANEDFMEAGEFLAQSGNFNVFERIRRDYRVPINPELWPYVMYIGAETFPLLASVKNSRREEFEDLCLKICPLQQWLGILVDYE